MRSGSGSWEVEEMRRNDPVIRFWTRVIDECTGGDYREEPVAGFPRQVFINT